MTLVLIAFMRRMLKDKTGTTGNTNHQGEIGGDQCEILSATMQ